MRCYDIVAYVTACVASEVHVISIATAGVNAAVRYWPFGFSPLPTSQPHFSSALRFVSGVGSCERAIGFSMSEFGNA